MTTERLYYHDSYQTRFTARVVERSSDGLRLCLDRTAFYPTSGGQPHDTGTIQGVPVVDVVDEESRIVHVVAQPIQDDAVDCAVDWPRRFDHMQQHTGQHLLSAVLQDMFGWATVGFHLGTAASTIDLDTTQAAAAQIQAAEERANELVFEDRQVRIGFETAAEAQGLRKAPPRTGALRIIEIEGLDRSACGGTHVRSTAQIGPIFVRKAEKIRSNVRLEFLCGLRAIRRARADYAALSRIALGFSAPLDEAPGLVESQRRALVAAEKALAKARAELARKQGMELYASLPPDPDGFRRYLHRIANGAIDDEVRALAQGFTAGQRAVFVAAGANPPCLLLAVSSDSGLHAGETLKGALSLAGGRGGGNAQLAQGSVASQPELEKVLAALPIPVR
jgi:alanyl-tRNA synthetase